MASYNVLAKILSGPFTLFVVVDRKEAFAPESHPPQSIFNFLSVPFSHIHHG